MALVNITNIQVLDNPCLFTKPFQFEITFECNAELKEDLEWKLVYVGSPETWEYDQELESIMVGPVPVGVNKFIFEADPPDVTKLREHEVVGVTVVILSCYYRSKEFIRVAYYVNNEYMDEELRNIPLEDEQGNSLPPPPLVIEKLYRNILADKPKVTRYMIDWDAQSNNTENDSLDVDMQVEVA
ncbi:hypothetical protein BZG36_05081 [Bifiguratus adelaidae]|uniref:Anti-silencing function protein 1 n=1 Tax=Bifiguratus adelaidae TaxID=1938954 RepID=A0A261XUK3_9FUNG|nr:hypothetical protein BZG36_05081 [Bifiguratus adelaidae]